MGEIGDVFDGLSDPRRVSGQQHSLHDILVIALCTLLCGGETCTDMALFGRAKREFLESFLKLERGIPSHDTFSRVFRLLDPEEFHTWFLGFMRQFAQGCRGVVALDGKTLRRPTTGRKALRRCIWCQCLGRRAAAGFGTTGRGG